MSASVKPRRVLVFGGSGWVGSVLGPRLAAEGHVVHAPRHADVDVADREAVREAVRHMRPDAVINLAAAQAGEADEDLRRVNANGAGIVAQAAAEVGARLLQVSSDMVLDGRNPPYADDAPACPLTPYGRSKAEGEDAVRAAHPAALLVRTSVLWDPRAIDRGTAAFLARLAGGHPCRLFADEIRCPLPRRTLAEALARLLPLDVAGTLNVAGKEACSREVFYRRLLEHFDVAGRERVESVRIADLEAAGAPPRPRDLTLDVRRASTLLALEMPGADPGAA